MAGSLPLVVVAVMAAAVGFAPVAAAEKMATVACVTVSFQIVMLIDFYVNPFFPRR